MTTARRAAAALFLVVAACGGPESRIRKQQALFDSYSPEVQAKLKAGEVEVGYTSEMVRMALGKPTRKTMRTTAAATEEVWTYGDASVSPGVGLSIGGGTMGGFGGIAVGGSSSPYGHDRAVIVFEGGKVTAVEKLKR